MKQLMALAFFIFSSFYLIAQDKDIVTEHYKVEGVCGQCKQRIEDAAYTKGVKKAEWSKETHELTITYRPSKTNAKTILTNVAKAGHSNELATAAEKDYDALPSCCAYKTVKKH